MLFTKEVLEKFFDPTGESDEDSMGKGRSVEHYDIKVDLECWVNGKYKVDYLEVGDNFEIIFDECDQRWLRVSEDASMEIFEIKKSSLYKS